MPSETHPSDASTTPSILISIEEIQRLKRKTKKKRKKNRGTTCSSRRQGEGVNYRFVSVHEPGAHNFILSSLGLYLDLLAGRWTRYFGFIYGPRHAAASRGKVASVASALAESGGGTIEKIPPPSIYLSATDC